MPKKNLIDPAFSEAFHSATAIEQSRRSASRRTQLQQKKSADAQAAQARKEAAKKEASVKAFENKVTLEIFPALEKLVKNVFGEGGCLAARIASNEKTGETRLELTPTYHSTTSEYWMTATVKGEQLYVQQWGRAIDPQLRGYKRPVTLDDLHIRVAGIITNYASDAELKKLQKLVKKPQSKAKTTEPKPEGISIIRPLQLKLPASHKSG